MKSRGRTTIFVARLHPDTKEETLKSKFKRYGSIRQCRLIVDIVTGISRRYGFIEFKHLDDAKDAVRHMNRTIIDGETILVDFEMERKLKGWKPRRLGGGFGGYKESGQLRFGCSDRPFRPPISINDSKKTVVDLSRKIKTRKTYNVTLFYIITVKSD